MLIDSIIIKVEETLEINVSSTCRKPNFIDARMIVYKIAKDAKISHWDISVALGLNHASITNYSKKFDSYSRSVDFRLKYAKCLLALEEFSEENLSEKQRLEIQINRSKRRIAEILEKFMVLR